MTSRWVFVTKAKNGRTVVLFFSLINDSSLGLGIRLLCSPFSVFSVFTDQLFIFSWWKRPRWGNRPSVGVNKSMYSLSGLYEKIYGVKRLSYNFWVQNEFCKNPQRTISLSFLFEVPTSLALHCVWHKKLSLMDDGKKGASPRKRAGEKEASCEFVLFGVKALRDATLTPPKRIWASLLLFFSLCLYPGNQPNVTRRRAENPRLDPASTALRMYGKGDRLLAHR